MLTNFDVDYSPSKTDFQSMIFLDGDYNQIRFKNGVQSESGWKLIDPADRKNYRVIVDCSGYREKQRNHYNELLKNPPLEHQLENIEHQLQYLLKNIELQNENSEQPSMLQTLACQLKNQEGDSENFQSQDYVNIVTQMRDRVKREFQLK